MVTALGAAALLLAMQPRGHAQSIEPRSYSNIPIGVNFLVAGYAYTDKGLSFDTALPLTDPKIRTGNAVAGYARSFEAWGQSAKFDMALPYTWLAGSALYRGSTVDRDVNGFGDPLLRVSVNFYGAPALTVQEFHGYEQDLIVGASLQVSVPAGQYDPTKLVNIGTNRWFFKPEVGASKAWGKFTLELKGSATFFTTNTDFFNGDRRAQDPVYSMQANAIYNFPHGIWASLDATYFAGGRTTLNDELNRDLQQNWRVGGTLAFPIDARNSIKLYASTGVSARTGNSFDLLGIAWQYRWGGGL